MTMKSPLGYNGPLATDRIHDRDLSVLLGHWVFGQRPRVTARMTTGGAYESTHDPDTSPAHL